MHYVKNNQKPCVNVVNVFIKNHLKNIVNDYIIYSVCNKGSFYIDDTVIHKKNKKGFGK